jgi:hypothetical protein
MGVLRHCSCVYEPPKRGERFGDSVRVTLEISDDMGDCGAGLQLTARLTGNPA